MPGSATPAERHDATLARPRVDRRYARLVALLGPSEGARVYLEELRWPDGVACPRCSSDAVGWIATRSKYGCRGCKYQFRVTAGTVLHDSHVSMEKWLEAVAAIVGSEDGFPANRLKDVLGGGYKTAWFVGHRIRAAMTHPASVGAPVALAADHAAVGLGGAAEAAAAGEARHVAAAKWAYARAQIAGAYHRPSTKHLEAYWNEAQWRATHVANPDAFRDTVRALLDTGPLPYDELVDGGRARAEG